jgi:hypothetical protein
MLQGIPLFRSVSENSAVRKVGSLLAIWTTCHLVRMLICPLLQPSGWRAIPSGPQTDQALSVRTTLTFVRTLTVSRSFYSSLHPSGRLSSQSGRLSVFDQVSDSFQVHLWEDWCNRPDDVDSHLDALLLKARISIQIQPSGCQLAWSERAFNRYGNCGFDFNRLDACLSWPRRVHSKYGNCMLKINRSDGHPPWSRRAKPYMEITCSGHATVRMTVPHR